jgi:aflatoxin B1 aldehyde reductase
LNIKDGNDGVIIGVSSLDQLDQNLKACEKSPLPEEVVQALGMHHFFIPVYLNELLNE